MGEALTECKNKKIVVQVSQPLNDIILRYTVALYGE